MYEVEKGIKCPKASKGPASIQYPFKDMKIGDSFFVPITGDRWMVGRKQSSILSAARYSTIKVTTRQVKGGIRVWRIS